MILLLLFCQLTFGAVTDIPFPGALPWTPGPQGPTGSFKIIFTDEFGGSTLNTKLWSYNLWYFGIINNEQQAYRPEQVSVGNGLLYITAEKKRSAFWWTEKANNPWRVDPPVYTDYASGMIHTLNKFHFTHGVAEVRLKVPCCGKGLWSGFWLLAADKTLPQPRPEIDVVEVLNDGGHFNEKIAHFNYHTPSGSTPSEYVSPISLYWAFHRYTVEWSPSEIVFYVDGVERGRRYKGEAFNGPMHIILNLAVGGSWPGAPNDATTFPSQLIVDYVRVWKRL